MGERLTEVYQRNKNVGIVLVRVCDVTEAEYIELIISVPTSGMNREQNRPGN